MATGDLGQCVLVFVSGKVAPYELEQGSVGVFSFVVAGFCKRLRRSMF